MLVLTRKVGEGIAIGDEIKIIVMQVKGKQVRLGIKASPSTVVHREEIYQRIQEENHNASQPDARAIAEAVDIIGNDTQVERQGSVLRRSVRKKKPSSGS